MLTTEQQAKLIFRSTQSRRLAKRYLREHGIAGRAEELDVELAKAQANPEAVAAAEQMRFRATVASAAVEADKVRQELADKLETIALAARGEWERVIGRIPFESVSGDPEHVRDAVERWGSADTVAIAALAAEQDRDGAIEFDGTPDAILERISAVVNHARYQADSADAFEKIKAESRPDGRWAIVEYYRKTMSIDSNCEKGLAFDDQETAVACRALMGDYSTSSYNVSIVDTQPEAEGVEV